MKTPLLLFLAATYAAINANPNDPIETAAAAQQIDDARAQLADAIPIDAELNDAIEKVKVLALKAGVSVPVGTAPVPAPAATNSGEPTHEAPRPGQGDRPLPIH